ncbi:hypothetical protein [Streptomyces solicathayae]|uniref:Integral membrane protein n=1 Tax=Streptomyces solicathayae TaxID=3081768 RepID=A0ABZ0LZ06_9ACTN|nr:hypothetical protein [Streptomyces sp. HUAS YS2]WOX24679.1 hypothetical protein R2D22_26175 [Streptomyces sp. HUAS YS2]
MLRGVAYTALPAEIVLVVLFVAGVRVPEFVVVVAEGVVLGLFVAEVAAYATLRRRGLSRQEAAGVLVPEAVLRLIGHELRLMASLGLWVMRRRVGVGAAARAFSHARDQAALMYGFAFVCLVETVGMSYLLADLPVVHAVVLVLDVYTVMFVLGLHAASVTRPHVLSDDSLRLRQGAHVDVRVPLGLIASVRHESLFTHDKADGELDLAVGSQTSVTVELSEAVNAPRFLGGPRAVRILRFHADEPRELVRALTQARTALSPSPGQPV